MTEVQPVEIERFYRPRSIAVVGAHDTRAGLAGLTEKAITHAKAVGAAFHPVNPKRESVFGIPCVASLTDLQGPIDVVVVQVGDPVGVIDAAADAGLKVGFYLVFSNGFSELGTPEGVARERSLLEAVRRAGARLVGPNTNVNAWDPLADLPGRRLAVVSQSGVQGRPLTQAQELGVALSYWAPTGNEADLEAADFAEFFVRDPETAAVCGYIEGFNSGEKLRSAAIAAIENDTPIVLVKVGRSSLGSSMAQSHTGHLAGADEVYDAFFEQFGMVRVPDVDQLVEVGVALARCPIPTAEGVVICSASGGTAAHVADLATLGGLSMPSLSARTQADLAEVIPAGFRLDNPVDNGGAVVIGDREAGRRIWELCLRDEHIGVMLCPIPASAPQLTDAMIEIVLQVAATATKPILPIWSGPSVRHPGYQALWDAGLPVFRNVSNAVAAARALIGHPARTPRLKEIARLAREHPSPAVPSGEGWVLEESESTRWLESHGIPFARHALAGTVEEAVEAAETIGCPVVLKGRGAAHKSERGFVVTGLADAAAVRAAAELLRDRGAAGFLVAEQVSGGIELLVGITADPVLGPVVLVGAGGVTAEAQRDVARSVLPLTRERAMEMLAGLRISPLLDGWRGAPAADRDAVVDLLLKLASIAETGQVVELDVNPILARPGGVLGLDALVRLAPGVTGPVTGSGTGWSA